MDSCMKDFTDVGDEVLHADSGGLTNGHIECVLYTVYVVYLRTCVYLYSTSERASI